MSKRSVFTTVTPLPAGISRETVMSTLHDHLEMIDLNPLVQERHPIKPPNSATAEEYHCQWYSLTDKVAYLPGGLMSGKVSYNACFHDLENGLQTHCYAPMGLIIKGKWTMGGSLPGEPVGPVELGLGVPLQGLWLREDVDMKCNIMMTGFVKKTLKKAHSSLVSRIMVRAQIVSGSKLNQALTDSPRQSLAPSQSSHSEFRSQSNVENLQGGFPPYGTQNSPPIRPEQNNDLYPKPLSSRNSSPSGHSSLTAQHARTSYQGSISSSQAGRSSYQASGPNAGPRVSWNHLNSSRSPSMNQVDPVYQNADPNQPPVYQNQQLPQQMNEPKGYHIPQPHPSNLQPNQFPGAARQSQQSRPVELE